MNETAQKIIEQKLEEHKELASNVAKAEVPKNARKDAWTCLQYYLQQLALLCTNYPGSRKGLLQVLYASNVHPHELESFKFSYPHDKEIYDVTVNILNAKLLLLETALKEKAVAEQIKTDNINKENDNGTKEN